jgi:hypothetical protein
MELNIYSSATVTFSDEEKEILQKACDLLKGTASELWNGNWGDNEAAEDLSIRLSGVVEDLSRIINGKFD